MLQRAVFTRSDLTGAIVEGADFTNALLDRTQQMVGVGECVLPGREEHTPPSAHRMGVALWWPTRCWIMSSRWWVMRQRKLVPCRGGGARTRNALHTKVFDTIRVAHAPLGRRSRRWVEVTGSAVLSASHVAARCDL